VLRGDRHASLEPDPAEINGVRWVDLADAHRWSRDSYCPHQLSRFVAKLDLALRQTTALR
jgi:hypothetical protein